MNKSNINKKVLEASCMMSYLVARTGKTHAIVEDFILPAAADMTGILLEEKVQKAIQTMPSSNNTVSQRISDMAGDVLKQLLLRIQASEFYALQLDESTDLARLAQLLVYGRHSGVVTSVQAVASDANWVHCSIHREALAAKRMPDSLKNVLDTTVKMVNFIKARPLNYFPHYAMIWAATM